MEVILMEDIPSLGRAGDLVKVSDGYARNYLLPRKKALLATASNLKALEHEKRLLQHKLNKMERDAHKLAQRIEEISCTIAKPVGEGGKLFGAVTSADIEGALREQGVIVDRRKIELEEPIKNLGVYTVPIRLHPQVIAQLKLWVVKE
ncbi:MAG: 50S ribosomal protein L9 [Deltaproteobacteria bacterium]|nr:MAG: 50S ribosomal protein L9 [Deltaproteobacteria bacterium]